MNNEETIKVDIRQTNINFPDDTIGIDIGQSLTKIAYLDEQKNMSLLTLPTQTDYTEIKNFLKSQMNKFRKINFTGGRAFKLYQEFSNRIESSLLDEFQSNIKGIDTLYLLSKKKKLTDALIINIGTGTSIVLKKDTFIHLGGSAMGGGFFMGIIELLFNITNYQEAITIAQDGLRYNVDLKVSDIYDPKDHRVNLIFKEFTAASFGKISENIDLQSIRKEDVINSLICLIGENVGTLAYLFANNNYIKDLVFCGGFLRENNILKRILEVICKINKKNAIFLKNAEYCGAIGAVLS